MTNSYKLMVDFSTLLPNLQAAYAAEGRFYHNWQHITAMLRHFDDVEAHLNSPDIVKAAIYYHDVIYDPLAKDNEAQSAELATQELASFFNANDLQHISILINATAGHALPSDLAADLQSNCAYFLDIDLSILGTDREVYDQYEIDIRQEYAMIPVELFNAGRAQILQNFLERDRLYFSDHFHDQWEIQARRNLARAIDRLLS